MTDHRRSTDPLVLALAMGIREIAERRARGELPPPAPLGAARLRIVRAVDEREPAEVASARRASARTEKRAEEAGPA